MDYLTNQSPLTDTFLQGLVGLEEGALKRILSHEVRNDSAKNTDCLPAMPFKDWKQHNQVWSYHFKLSSAFNEDCSTVVMVYFRIIGSFLTSLLL